MPGELEPDDVDGAVQARMPGMPNEGPGGYASADVLKVKSEGGRVLGFEALLLLLRHSEARSPPVGQALSVSCSEASGEVTVRWKGAEDSL